jgi:predicted nucleic acid-binding Zn ribbon protein
LREIENALKRTTKRPCIVCGKTVGKGKQYLCSDRCKQKARWQREKKAAA